jgi:hypothetical protein
MLKDENKKKKFNKKNIKRIELIWVISPNL